MVQNPNIDVPLKGDQIPEFVETAVFKRDVFSETHAGYFIGNPETRIIRRVVSAAPWWSKPLAWILARREIRGLKTVRGIEGVPQLLAIDKDGLYRSWSSSWGASSPPTRWTAACRPRLISSICRPSTLMA